MLCVVGDMSSLLKGPRARLVLGLLGARILILKIEQVTAYQFNSFDRGAAVSHTLYAK